MSELNKLVLDLNHCLTHIYLIFFALIFLSFVSSQNVKTEDFSPSVTAKCERGVMYIFVVTLQSFYGVIHTRGNRRPPCLVYGNGGFNTTLKVSLLADESDEIYCGIHKHNGQRSVSLAVRAHKSLELSDDKYYFMTCEQSGYKNVRGGTYSVSLKLTELSGQRVSRTVHGNPYLLNAQLTPYDIITSLRMKNCFAFGADTERVQLIDDSGCPANLNLISQFLYNSSHSAEAIVYEMFKFPETNKLFIQCDVILCRGGCQEPVCDTTVYKRRDLAVDGYSLMSASTTVYVFEPSEEKITSATQSECTEWRFPWLIILTICLTVLLLLMLLLNLLMCSSLSCRCVKTEIVEKEGSEMEEYDPYQVNWISRVSPNSRYGSPMSVNKPYVFNDSSGTSNRSLKSHHSVYCRENFSPKHYSTLQNNSHTPHTPHTRPLSRYSTHSTKSQNSQKSRKSQKSQKLPKIIEIDYSNDYKPYTYSLR